jgi:hypothetical protein
MRQGQTLLFAVGVPYPRPCEYSLDKLVLHRLSFHLYVLQGGGQPLMFSWSLTKQTGLGGAKIPRADKRALQALQSASTRTEVATVLSPPAEQLPLKDRDTIQVKEQKVLEIGPHPGALAADIPASSACLFAQFIHEGEDRHQLITLFTRQPHRCIQFVSIASYLSF